MLLYIQVKVDVNSLYKMIQILLVMSGIPLDL